MPGMPVRNLCSDEIFFDADDAVVGAAHAHIGLVGGAAGQHALVGGGNVGVRAQDGSDAAIEMPAHGDLFAGGFGMKIDEDDFGLDAGQQVVDGVEGVVGAVHEDAAHAGR